MQSKLLGLLHTSTKVSTDKKWPKNAKKNHHNKPNFSTQKTTQNRNRKWIYNIRVYVQTDIFTQTLINFTRTLLATFRKSAE